MQSDIHSEKLLFQVMLLCKQQEMICVRMRTVSVTLLFHLNISMLLAIKEYNIHSKILVVDNNDDEIHTTTNDLCQDDKAICKTSFSLKHFFVISNHTR